MANLINESEVRSTWSPIIESATGINDANKLAWMSTYCHNHKLYEDANIMSLNPNMNLAGMGKTSFPSAGVDGSGDKAPSLLPLAMQVAAQTVGLDLVPVIPMAGPMGLLSYLDFTYEGGRLDNGVTPTYIKTSAAAAVGNDVAVGNSRIDGKVIIEVKDALSGTEEKISDRYANAELVKALEDHILGFTAADKAGTPFSREAGESTPDKVMGLSLFSKSVSAQTYQVAAAVTREQVQDLKQFGVDAVAQVESVLTNELTQSINQHILGAISKIRC